VTFADTERQEAWLSDHFDADDSRTDLTDLYVFPAVNGADRSVLILDANPEAVPTEVSFDPAASYEIKIDTDGDFQADVAFHVVFEARGDGDGVATVYRALGDAARGTGPVGDVVVAGARVASDGTGEAMESNGYRFFAGLRSDPHFKDVKGLRNDFQFTGDDPIARRNVFGIVLELPNDALGGRSIRLWARAMVPGDGVVKQVDQTGRPGTSITFNRTEEDLLAFGESSPVEQRGRFGDRFAAFLEGRGYPEAEAREVALGYLPDVLAYDLSAPAEYPNGRRLTDDTADLLVSLLTRGRITTDLAGPHTDLLDEFPYLGAPHPPGDALTHLE
jgi:uncharacterized protein DUF4331